MTKPRKPKGPRRIPGSSTTFVSRFEPTDWRCILLLAGLVFIFFHKILLGSAYFWEDFLYQNYPFRSFAATSIAMGQLPLWNPYTFNGMPFLADIQTTVLYLPSLALSLFVTGGKLHFYWLELMIILHFVLAGGSMFYLAKSYGLRQIPSLFAGAIFMLSGFMITHAIHQQIITLVAWYPFVLLIFRKALDEDRWLYVFVTALILGHSTLAGYPQLSLYLYFFLFLYFLFELLTRFGGRELISRPAVIMSAKAATVVGLSVAVAMIQLLPTLELSALSQRAEITYQKSIEGSLSWGQLLTFLFPKFFGTASAEGYAYWGPGTYWYFWETCVYLGLLPLLLLAMSISRVQTSRSILFFSGMALFSLLFALGENFFLYPAFFDFVPGFDKFRIPARMGIFLTFSVALLAAFAVQHILYAERPEQENKKLKTILLASGGFAVLLYILIQAGMFQASFEFLSTPQIAATVGRDSHIAFAVLLLSLAVLYAAIMNPRAATVTGFLLIGVFAIDMYIFGGTQNNAKNNPADYFKRTADLVKFIKDQGADEMFRVNTRNSQGMIMDRNQGMIDRIFMMEGYTPLALQRAYAPLATSDQSFDLLNVRYKTVTDEQNRTLRVEEHHTRLPRAFFLYRFHVEANEEGLLRFLKSAEFDHRTIAILEKDPGRTLNEAAETPYWNARIVSYENNAITIDATTDADGILVLSEIHYPGWNAYVDGKQTEVFRTDYNLRGIFVDKGTHTIEFRFEPESFRRGSMITIATIFVCVVGGGISVRRTRNRKAASIDEEDRES